MLRFIRDLCLRRRLLTAAGAGSLYKRIEELERRCIAAEGAVKLSPSLPVDDRELRSQLDYFMNLRSGERLIELDYPVVPRVRYGWESPPHPGLQSLFSADEVRYGDHIRSFLPFLDIMSAIPARATRHHEPHWLNDWFPAFDAISLYSFLAIRQPRRLIEIGSGNSTRFARRAIQDHSLQTSIVSIDPSPRSEIDAICDEVVRLPLEQVPGQFFNEIGSDDILFFDGSHRAFQNSDATIFLTEVIPNLMNGTMVGVHDIFLPYDYPPAWLKRYYSEQYLLACWLLGGERLRIELPVFYCTKTPHLHSLLDDFWRLMHLKEAHHSGGIFWFTTQIGQGLSSIEPNDTDRKNQRRLS
jgi:Methyltransferase domain